MLITEADITVQAGRGGNGRLAYENKVGSGPNGGDGGRGGSIYVIGVDNVFALSKYAYEKEFKAEDGARGGTNKKDGISGKDITLKFPMGTSLTIKGSDRVIYVMDKKKRVKIAKGGIGGRGNFALRFRNSTSNNFYEKGKQGTKLELHAELKLVADFGLVGLPNAGKSSLLNELTSTRVKVADYPFTTIEPNIGKLSEKVIADIPGLIEGASAGKGLGTKFLKHIEKVGLILHCIACDSENVVKDYEIVLKEIKNYRRDITEREKVILLTKSDMISNEDLKSKIKELEVFGHKVLTVSIHDWDSMEKLKDFLINFEKKEE